MRMVKTVMAAAVLLGFVGGAHGQTISIGFASEAGRALAISGVSLPERDGWFVTVSHPLGVDWLEATSELSRMEAAGSAGAACSGWGSCEPCGCSRDSTVRSCAVWARGFD